MKSNANKILSGYCDLYQQEYDGSPNPQNGAHQYDGWGFPYSDLYKYMGGTSMSNPLVAGGAVVVRDYYQKAHDHAASAALTKATLVWSDYPSGPRPFALVVDTNFAGLTITGALHSPLLLELDWEPVGPVVYSVYSSTLPYGPFSFVADTIEVTYPVTTAPPPPTADYFQVWVGDVPSLNTLGRFPFVLEPGTP